MLKSDLPSLLLIEQAAHVVPWTEDIFHICFRAGFMGWVVEVEEKIVGFIIISFQLEECHILNLCVMPLQQSQGLGRQLLNHALLYAEQKGAGLAFLEVRRSNTRAIRLYKRMQFRLVGERKNYYATTQGTEDALIFARELPHGLPEHNN